MNSDFQHQDFPLFSIPEVNNFANLPFISPFNMCQRPNCILNNALSNLNVNENDQMMTPFAFQPNDIHSDVLPNNRIIFPGPLPQEAIQPNPAIERRRFQNEINNNNITGVPPAPPFRPRKNRRPIPNQIHEEGISSSRKFGKVLKKTRKLSDKKLHQMTKKLAIKIHKGLSNQKQILEEKVSFDQKPSKYDLQLKELIDLLMSPDELSKKTSKGVISDVRKVLSGLTLSKANKEQKNLKKDNQIEIKNIILPKEGVDEEIEIKNIIVPEEEKKEPIEIKNVFYPNENNNIFGLKKTNDNEMTNVFYPNGTNNNQIGLKKRNDNERKGPSELNNQSYIFIPFFE